MSDPARSAIDAAKKCARCGDPEFRVGGYCSCQCADMHDVEQERDHLSDRATALEAERDALIRERDDWKNNAGQRHDRYDALERQRDSLANELAEVKWERDRLETANVALQIGWAKALDETQRYREAAQKAQTAHANEDDAWQAGYQKGVSHGLDHLTPGLEAARTKLAKAEEKRAALCDRIVELSKEVDAYQADFRRRSDVIDELKKERDDARRQMTDMKREVQATLDQMTQALAELGIAKRRIGELESAAMQLIEAEVTATPFNSNYSLRSARMAELRRVATGKE